LFDTSELLEDKVGITFDFIRTSPYADMFSGLRPLSDEERAVLEASTDQTYEAFLQNVSEGRDISTAEVDSIGQGRIWSGAQAKEVGLVDVLGDLNMAISLAAERAGLEPGAYGTRILPRPKTFFEEVTSSMETRAYALFTRLTTSPLERALLRQAELARQLLDMQGSVQARLPMSVTIN
jgi:protease-4